jgi:hypothetical protein
LPSVTQLQNVVNNSNPLILSSGNSALDQEFRHNVFIRYNTGNIPKGKSFFIFARLNTASNYIGNSTTLAANDTVVNGVRIRKGAQLTMPVNLNGYRSTGTFMTYGFPFKLIKSTVNFNVGANYTRSPALINGLVNFSNNIITNSGLVIASNVSEKIDFTVSYSMNYNIVENSLQSNLNNRFMISNFNARVNYMPNKHIVFSSDITNSSYQGLGTGFNQSIWLCNGGLGYKFMKDNRSEIKLSVFDALKQNRAINRSVTETYIEDKNTRILTRFYMLTFTYTIRNFKVKSKAPASAK